MSWTAVTVCGNGKIWSTDFAAWWFARVVSFDQTIDELCLSHNFAVDNILMLFDSALNEYQRQHRMTTLMARAWWSAFCASGSRLLGSLSIPARWKNDRQPPIFAEFGDVFLYTNELLSMPCQVRRAALVPSGAHLSIYLINTATILSYFSLYHQSLMHIMCGP